MFPATSIPTYAGGVGIEEGVEDVDGPGVGSGDLVGIGEEVAVGPGVVVGLTVGLGALERDSPPIAYMLPSSDPT